jgi:iron complex outermembrane receptor protein
MKYHHKINSSLAVAVASALFTMSAFSQQATDSDVTANVTGNLQATDNTTPDMTQEKAEKGQITSGIATVVVTAQKRKEDPNKIAMSISTISGDDLQQQHIEDFGDLTRSIPNISFSTTSGAGPGLDNIEMRGVSSSAGSATVGIYVDDTSVTIPNMYDMGATEPKFFDLERVEVLRGPQGTLYGSSSMGGTIKFITNQPNLKEYSVDTFADYSNTKGAGSNTSGYIVGNIPLIADELAVRIGVQGNRTAGFINQIDSNGNVIGNGINSNDDQEVRLAVKWKPTKNLTITPSIFYQEVHSDGSSAFLLNTLPLYESNVSVREPSTDKFLLPTLNINYDWDGINVTSVSSYFDRHFDRSIDGKNYITIPLTSTNPSSGCYFYVVACGGSVPNALLPAILALPSASQLTSQAEQFSQELRFASKAYEKGGSPWTWVGGLYFANERTGAIENDPVIGLNATLAQYGVDTNNLNSLANSLYFPGNPSLGIPPGTPYLNPFPNDNTYYGNQQTREQQKAIFGEVNYYFTPTLHATVGMRYLTATNSLEQINGLYETGLNTNANAVFQNTTSTNASTPKFALTWEVDPNNTLYTSAAKGFRLGGGNQYVPVTFCASDLAANGLTEAPATYKQDSLWSYEVGSKSRVFDNRLSFNADIFYLKWNNIQQNVYLPGCSYDYNTNAGDAVSKGAEIEVKFKPVPQLLLSASGGYDNAEFSDSQGQINGVIGAVKGAAIEGVPKYNGQLSAKYSFALGDKSAYLLATEHWVGRSNGSLVATDPDYNRPQYHTVDTSAGMSFGTFDVSVYVKNALNDNTIIQHPNTNETNEGFRLNARTIGMNVFASF